MILINYYSIKNIKNYRKQYIYYSNLTCENTKKKYIFVKSRKYEIFIIYFLEQEHPRMT